MLSAKVKLMRLQESLLTLEMDTVEVVATLITEFDRAYSEMAEANKLQYNAYFTQVRCFATWHMTADCACRFRHKEGGQACRAARGHTCRCQELEFMHAGPAEAALCTAVFSALYDIHGGTRLPLKSRSKHFHEGLYACHKLVHICKVPNQSTMLPGNPLPVCLTDP